MMKELTPTAGSKEIRWGRPALILGGVVWILRASLEVLFQPDYWNPKSAVDYAAVGSFSLGLFLLALGLIAVHLGRHTERGPRRIAWNLGISLSIVGAVVAGAANFLEDWLGIKAFGDFFVYGLLSLFVGLIVSGISTIRADDISRWTGWLLLACAIGLGLPDQGGLFIVGISLIVLGFIQKA